MSKIILAESATVKSASVTIRTVMIDKRQLTESINAVQDEQIRTIRDEQIQSIRDQLGRPESKLDRVIERRP